MHFGIHRFEHPNRKGAYPVIAVTWYEAKGQCESQGKRLATEDEWIFACEGEEAAPYPTGYPRDEQACVIDCAWKLFDAARLGSRDSTLAKMEVDYLLARRGLGARSACRSPFGVYDMTGNVDEWTSSVQSEGFRSILKGGYWGPGARGVDRPRAPTTRTSTFISRGSAAAPTLIGREASPLSSRSPPLRCSPGRGWLLHRMRHLTSGPLRKSLLARLTCCRRRCRE